MARDKFRKLSRFSNSGNEDEYFEYADDPDYEEIQPRGGRRLFAFSLYGALLTVGVAFGAGIALNSGGGSGVEFGQGVSQTISCQGSRDVLVTPFAGFQNADGAGNFTFDSVYIENIHKDCLDKDFILKLYDNSSSSPLNLSDDFVEGEIYDKFTAVRFHWEAEAIVTLMGSQNTDVEFVSDVQDSVDFNNNETGFLVTLDADILGNYANAGDVYKITIETAPHTGATS